MATKSPNPFFHVTFAREIPIPDRTRVSDGIYVDFMHHVRDAARHQLPLWMDIDGVEIVGVEVNDRYPDRDDEPAAELRVVTRANAGAIAAAGVSVMFEFEYWNDPSSSGAVLVDQYALIADVRFPVDSAAEFESARVAANVQRQGRSFSLPTGRHSLRARGLFR
jgi:hypothetical protein